jgi:hypothetical protein
MVRGPLLNKQIHRHVAKTAKMMTERRIEKRDEKKNGNKICLTSYAAWCYRIEKDERKFYREVQKHNIRREEIKKKVEKNKQKKESFVRKFFPTCKSSPSGTQKLINEKSTDVKSARERDMGKAMARSSDLLSASSNISNFFNSRTVTQNINSTQWKTSFESGGRSGLSTVEDQPSVQVDQWV